MTLPASGVPAGYCGAGSYGGSNAKLNRRWQDGRSRDRFPGGANRDRNGGRLNPLENALKRRRALKLELSGGGFIPGELKCENSVTGGHVAVETSSCITPIVETAAPVAVSADTG